MRLMTIALTLGVMLIAAGAVAEELMDGWNVDAAPAGGAIYAMPANYAMPYTPPQPYMLTRVEIWGAGSDYFDDDEVTIMIQADAGGEPGGDVLASAVTAVNDGDAYWCGSDFPEPLMVSGEAPIWLVYFPMPWSPVGTSLEGDEIETWWSGDQIHWEEQGTWTWKVKFWGEPIVGAENASWSQIKNLYR